MSALDRDKARTVLAKSTLVDMSNDEIIDELEACVLPNPEQPALALSVVDAIRIDNAIVRGGWSDSLDDQELASRIEDVLPPDWA